MKYPYLLVPLSILLLVANGSAQVASWEDENSAGLRAYQQRNYADAEKFFNSAFKQATEFGERDPRLATSLNNLASLEHAQRKYANAESLYRRSLDLSEKIFGPESPKLAGVLNNLGNLLQEQARYSEAGPLLQRALGIREKALGSEDPDVGVILTSLGVVRREEGKYSEAELLLQRALAIRQ
jgi:tetratricopeptide (TPR) repeat protein